MISEYLCCWYDHLVSLAFISQKKKTTTQYNDMQVYIGGAFRISSKLIHIHFFAIGK